MLWKQDRFASSAPKRRNLLVVIVDQDVDWFSEKMFVAGKNVFTKLFVFGELAKPSYLTGARHYVCTWRREEANGTELTTGGVELARPGVLFDVFSPKLLANRV